MTRQRHNLFFAEATQARTAVRLFALCFAAGLSFSSGLPSAVAQTPAVSTASSTVAEAKPAWAALTVAQQQALAPLKADWSSTDAPRKQKWLEVAAKLPSMNVEDRARIQQRMAEWVRMTPGERGRARIQFQEARQIAPGDRQEQWQAYQALSTDKRRDLAAQAQAQKHAPAAPPVGASGNEASAKANGPAKAPPVPVGAGGPNTKRNMVAGAPVAPSQAVSKQIAPTVVQAKPGATTSLVTTQAKPPVHHQAGLPKINARADFVNPSTLLPLRGPQGAAVAAVPPASSAVATP